METEKKDAAICPQTRDYFSLLDLMEDFRYHAHAGRQITVIKTDRKTWTMTVMGWSE